MSKYLGKKKITLLHFYFINLRRRFKEVNTFKIVKLKLVIFLLV